MIVIETNSLLLLNPLSVVTQNTLLLTKLVVIEKVERNKEETEDFQQSLHFAQRSTTIIHGQVIIHFLENSQ